MPRWRSTPAPNTHRRRRRGHTSTMKVASKARVDQVSRFSSDAPARSNQSGATKRCRSSMRSDQRDGGAVLPGRPARLRPRREQVAHRELQLQQPHPERRPKERPDAAAATVDGRVDGPQQAARRQHDGDPDQPQEQVAGVEDGAVAALQHHEAQHGDGGAEPRLEPHHRAPATRRAAARQVASPACPTEVGEQVPGPVAQIPFVEERALGEERVDVREEAQRPDGHHRPPAHPHERHRARCSAARRRTGPTARAAGGSRVRLIGVGHVREVDELVVRPLARPRASSSWNQPHELDLGDRRRSVVVLARDPPGGGLPQDPEVVGSHALEPLAPAVVAEVGADPRALGERATPSVVPSSKVTRALDAQARRPGVGREHRPTAAPTPRGGSRCWPGRRADRCRAEPGGRCVATPASSTSTIATEITTRPVTERSTRSDRAAGVTRPCPCPSPSSAS